MPDSLQTPDGGTAPTGHYAPRLGLFSATMLVVGGIIGAGIFLNPAIVAQRVGSGAATVGTWALGAIIAIIGAFTWMTVRKVRSEAAKDRPPEAL